MRKNLIFLVMLMGCSGSPPAQHVPTKTDVPTTEAETGAEQIQPDAGEVETCIEDFDGNCAPTMDAHCQASKECEEDGNCVLGPHNTCVAEDEALQCDAPEVRIDNMCRFPAGYTCDAECKSDNTCHALRLELQGDALPSSKPYVVCVESDDDCAKSAACKDEGRCKAAEVRTVDIEETCRSYYRSCSTLEFGGCVVPDEEE